MRKRYLPFLLILFSLILFTAWCGAATAGSIGPKVIILEFHGMKQGIIAEKIIEIAKKNNIPIKDDPDLIEILSQLELDEQIPPAVYQVVAEIFAFIYDLNTQYRKEKQTG